MALVPANMPCTALSRRATHQPRSNTALFWTQPLPLHVLERVLSRLLEDLKSRPAIGG